MKINYWYRFFNTTYTPPPIELRWVVPRFWLEYMIMIYSHNAADIKKKGWQQRSYIFRIDLLSYKTWKSQFGWMSKNIVSHLRIRKNYLRLIVLSAISIPTCCETKAFDRKSSLTNTMVKMMNMKIWNSAEFRTHKSTNIQKWEGLFHILKKSYFLSDRSFPSPVSTAVVCLIISFGLLCHLEDIDVK